MNYTHLNQYERYQIYILRKADHSVSEIAHLLGRHKSTISRELRRNRGQRNYRPKQAQRLADERQANCANAPRVSDATWTFAQDRLAEQWSPEQVAGYCKAQGRPGISHETIYQRVYADKRAGGELWRHLRCQKQRRKRYAGGRDWRGSIPGRVGIEARPAGVESRKQIGHWEGDTIIATGHRQALVSLVERKSRFALLAKVEHKTAEAVGDALVQLLAPFQARVKTLTLDNGLEFARHALITQQLGAPVYFAHPYASWERGSNENLNGLVRQYFPKKHRFVTISQQEIDLVMQRLNHRPRKCLGYRTPYDVFMQSLSRVALRT